MFKDDIFIGVCDFEAPVVMEAARAEIAEFQKGQLTVCAIAAFLALLAWSLLA